MDIRRGNVRFAHGCPGAAALHENHFKEVEPAAFVVESVEAGRIVRPPPVIHCLAVIVSRASDLFHKIAQSCFSFSVEAAGGDPRVNAP